MKHFQFLGLYNESGWHSPAFVTVNDQGHIESLATQKSEGIRYQVINGWFLPGIPNSHSHAFQIAMAGLAETTHASANSFWTWRNLMYELALKISPDDLEALATYAFTQMLSFGITHVAEFHYLHHDTKGQTYGNLSEMSDRLIAAATTAGIGLCLIPVFYKYSHFETPALPEQRRFVSTNLDTYFQLREQAAISAQSQGHKCGFGVHSIRAAGWQEIQTVFLQQNEPVHIHISEQAKEVEDCLKKWGRSPIACLADYAELKANHVLVHATHANPEELNLIQKSGATISLCPSTEANLGDGIFPLTDYSGNFSIGTDSNICLDPFEELRLLEYGQRLKLQRRNVIDKPYKSVGQNLYHKAWQTGALACGFEPTLSKGSPLTGFIVSEQAGIDASTPLDILLSKLVFNSHKLLPLDVFQKGNQIIKEGRHPQQENIHKSYVQTLKKLALAS